MKILHRFGVACFWGGLVAAALCALWLGLIITAPGRGWHEAAVTAAAIAGLAVWLDAPSATFLDGASMTYDPRKTIEHDADEPPLDRSKSPWGKVLILLLFVWGWLLYFLEPDWYQIGIGFITGGALASWAVDVTGNRVPKSWRGPPPGSGRG